MNKSDLKNGMVVELRNGRRLLVMDNLLFDKKFIKEVELNDFTDALIYIGLNKEFDIIKVYKNVRAFIETNCKPIWEREKDINWSKVPIGTKILFSINGGEYTEGLFIKKDGNKFIVCDDIKNRLFTSCNYCKLAEEPKEKVTFYDIEKEMNQYCYDQNEHRICQQECDTCVMKYILDYYNVTRKDNK